MWAPAGLFEVVDKLGDGIVQWADFVVKSTDFVVLSMPEVAGLPFVITGLVMAGGLAAALSTADGLLLTIANAFSHDLYYNVIDPKASLTKRLTITKVLLVVTALIAAYVATYRLAIIVELVAWAFSLAAASFFPALVMGIWWKRANRAGACWGMIVGTWSNRVLHDWQPVLWRLVVWYPDHCVGASSGCQPDSLLSGSSHCSPRRRRNRCRTSWPAYAIRKAGRLSQAIRWAAICRLARISLVEMRGAGRVTFSLLEPLI